ncbi:MAG: hypothetical protein ACJ8C4_13920 [Gemmataceae bacterium]
MNAIETAAQELKAAKEHLEACRPRHYELLQSLPSERTGQESSQFERDLASARTFMDMAQLRYDAAAIAHSRIAADAIT